ncbi:hypothetical protein CW304_08285 [Bacillus sp. UFRGS-B20]|nr:hypothetical protein CW304_08285 [Bacillus sp. UFRGS-B20]
MRNSPYLILLPFSHSRKHHARILYAYAVICESNAPSSFMFRKSCHFRTSLTSVNCWYGST